METIQPFIRNYVSSHCAPPDDVLNELEAETRAMAPDLQSTHYEGELCRMLAMIVGAREAVCLGVFTGYTTLCMARGMPSDGHILACEVNSEWAAIGQKYWEKDGLGDRIELRVASAVEMLPTLPEEPTVDLGYVGADKQNAPYYYEELLRRMRPGGTMIIGDALRSARLFEEDTDDADALVMRKLNADIAADERVDSVIVPAGDGATLIRKR